MAQHALVTTQQFNDDQLAIIRNTVAKDTSPDQFRLFIEVCKYHGLSPFARQIYAVVRNSKQPDGSYAKQMTIQTSIDGYRLLAERSGKYAGQVGPEWCGDDGVWKDVWLSDKPPAAARVGVLRKDFERPTWGVAKYKSYAQSTPLWTKMPDVLLAKCAESLALRKAFPAEMSGIYTSEEMQQADSDHDHLPTIAPLHTNVVEADDSTSTRQNDNASISRQDENLTVLPSGNKSARQNSVAAPLDSTASDAGHSDVLPPSEVDRVRGRYAKAYSVSEHDLEQKWAEFKLERLGKKVDDIDLSNVDLGKLNGQIAAQWRARKAS